VLSILDVFGDEHHPVFLKSFREDRKYLVHVSSKKHFRSFPHEVLWHRSWLMVWHRFRDTAFAKQHRLLISVENLSINKIKICHTYFHFVFFSFTLNLSQSIILGTIKDRIDL
jgi:hypothetical protein